MSGGTFFVHSDGEGYDLKIILTKEENLAVPYSDDCAKENNGRAVWPGNLHVSQLYHAAEKLEKGVKP